MIPVLTRCGRPAHTCKCQLPFTYRTLSHSSKPTDRFNERYEELSNHPDWSFASPEFPSNEQILEARNRVFARHPKTTFVALHVGNFAEDLQNVSESLDRFPNMHIDIAARLNELGRQPRAARKFFEKYQDRSFLEPTRHPMGTNIRSRFSTTASTKSTSDFWKRTMNTLITLQPRYRLRVVGKYPESIFPMQSCGKSITRMQPGF